MTVTYGLSVDGFVPKPLLVIRDELNTALRAQFGASISLSDRSIFGQIVGIIAAQYASLWELGQSVYSSQDPDKASGAALDGLSALTGTFRIPASFSVVPLVVTGVPITTTIQAGSKVATNSTAKQFAADADVTLVAATNWAATTLYSVSDRVTADGRIYQCTSAGTSGSVGPSGTSTSIADGSVTWTYVGDGIGYADVTATATETGPVGAFARDITTIVTSVSGWTGVINLLDATTGRDVAVDSELRALREAELASSGATTSDSIRAHVLALPGVVSVTIFVNNTDLTNSDNMPPHSVEALIRTSFAPDATKDQVFFDLLLANVAAGIQTTGTTTGTALDSAGTAYTIKFSRPEEKAIYATLDVTVDSSLFPADGADQIKDAIKEWGATLAVGRDAVASAISAKAFGIPGVLDVTSCLIGLTASPVSNSTIAISNRQLATYDTSSIVINATPGTP